MREVQPMFDTEIEDWSTGIDRTTPRSLELSLRTFLLESQIGAIEESIAASLST